MDTLRLDTRSHPVLNVVLWAVLSPVYRSLINSELSALSVRNCKEMPSNRRQGDSITTILPPKHTDKRCSGQFAGPSGQFAGSVLGRNLTYSSIS